MPVSNAQGKKLGKKSRAAGARGVNVPVGFAGFLWQRWFAGGGGVALADGPNGPDGPNGQGGGATGYPVGLRGRCLVWLGHKCAAEVCCAAVWFGSGGNVPLRLINVSDAQSSQKSHNSHNSHSSHIKRRPLRYCTPQRLCRTLL